MSLALAGLLATSTVTAFAPKSLAGAANLAPSTVKVGSELFAGQSIPEMTRAGTGWDSFCDVPEGTTIVPGIEIGQATTIGAGSLVTRDIAANTTAYGAPCRVVQNRDEAAR